MCSDPALVLVWPGSGLVLACLFLSERHALVCHGLGVEWSGLAFRGVVGEMGVWCGVVWCGVGLVCGVVWCGVAWCGVAWWCVVRVGVVLWLAHRGQVPTQPHGPQ